MREVSVIGVGMHKFGKFPEKRIEDLGREACLNAFQDSGVEPKEIEAVYCGLALDEITPGQRIAYEVGVPGVPTYNLKNACASGSTAFNNAWKVVASGVHDLALVIGAESMSRVISGVIPIPPTVLMIKMGMYAPSLFAVFAHRHMKEYGTTLEQIAMVSVKNHDNGVLNPYAQYQKNFTVEQIRSSRMISDPITLLECSPTGDGAAAAIICPSDIAKKYTDRAIKAKASVMTIGGYQSNAPLLYSYEAFKSAQEAYKMAGINPKDLDVLEVHDCFTIAELMWYESIGLCEKGESGKLIEEGVTWLTGELPVNPSGGLLAKGHPIGATGVAQICELVWQLRGESGPRQVDDAEIAMALNMGGVNPGLMAGMASNVFNVANTTILSNK